MGTHQSGSAPVILGPPGWFQPAALFGLPLLGLLVGWGVLTIADWVAGLAWAPFQGPFRLVAEAPRPAATVVVLVLGAAGGFVLGLIALGESLVVEVTSGEVTLRRGEKVTTLGRADLGAVFLDQKDVVFLDTDGREVARTANDLPAPRLRAALHDAEYPWHSSDPYADDYRRWIEDMPELSPAANAVLAARARAIAKDETEDVADLRRELIKLGIVLRDREGRQYWRRIPGH